MADRATDAKPAYQGIRTGGRSERVRSAVMQATLAELQSIGYAELSIPRIAKAAEVAVTTVYRRWPRKSDLLMELVTTLTAVAVPEPDTGTIEEDLFVLGSGVAASLTEPTLLSLMRSTLSLTNAEFHEVAAQHWRNRHAVAERIVLRAVERGEIPPQPDPKRVVETMTAAIWLRAFVTDGPLDPEAVRGLSEDALIIARHRPQPS